jgi:hypothetical protein
MDEFADFLGSMLVRRERRLWALPDDAWDAVIRGKGAGPGGPRDSVLGEYVPCGVHARVA